MWFLDIDQIYVIEIPFKKSKMLPISMVADIVNIGTEGLGISGATSSAGVAVYQWLSARLQYLLCASNGDTAVLH